MTRPKRHTSPVRQYALPLFMVLALFAAACSDEHQNIKPGIPEAEARKSLGEPSWVLTERSQVRANLTGHEQCAQSAAKVLVYDRPWYRRDVFVAVDGADRVACAFGGQVLKSD